MALSEARKRANAKYDKEHQTSINLKMKKEEAEKIKAFCSSLGIPVNTFIKSAIREKIERETEK